MRSIIYQLNQVALAFQLVEISPEALLIHCLF